MELFFGIYFWNPFFFSLFIASTNLFDQLVVDVCEPVMEGSALVGKVLVLWL